VEHLGPMGSAQMEEEGARVGVRTSGVHVGERMVETGEDEVVDGGEQGRGQVPVRWGVYHRPEEVAVPGHRPRDAGVEGRVPVAVRGEPAPHGGELVGLGRRHGPILDARASCRQMATPLSTKLGIRPGSTLVVLDAPAGLLDEGDLPADVVVRRRRQGNGRARADVVVAFFTRRARYERSLEGLGPMIFPDGGLWIAWPKRSSGVETDLTDHAVRAVALPLGLVDNKVCAIDDVWTGLRLVWRTTTRGTRRSGSG